MQRFIVRLLALAAALPAGSVVCAQSDLEKVEIRAEEIAPGMAVLFGAGGNIGVSHGPDATVLIDDQFAPLSSKIEAAITALGASPVKYVVNTHWHYDHTGSNEHFGMTGATIFAQENVRVRLASGGTVGGTSTPPAPPAALPVVTFDQGLRFHINGDTIDLMYLGGGHTDGDSVIFWREKNIVHMGDLYLKIPGFPIIDINSGGNVYKAINSLEQVIGMIDDRTKVIPGHGPMSNKTELVAYHAMIEVAVTRVEALRSQGMTLDQAVAAKPLAGIDRGTGFVGPDAFVTAIWKSIDR